MITDSTEVLKLDSKNAANVKAKAHLPSDDEKLVLALRTRSTYYSVQATNTNVEQRSGGDCRDLH